jgi:hypothetical protein
MKHTIKKAIAVLLLAALLLPTLVSCGASSLFFSFSSSSSRALKLLTINLNDQKGIDSYCINVEASMCGKSSGGVWSRSEVASYVMSNLNDVDNLLCYNWSESTLKEEDQEAVTTVVESGYADGKMFSHQAVSNGTTSNLTSPLTGQEYLEHVNGLNSTLLADILKTAANTITCEKNDDGEWVARFTDFKDTGLERVFIYFGTSASMFKNDIEGAELTFRATNKLIPIEMKFEVTFAEQKGSTSQLIYVSSYGSYNSAEASAPDLTDYKEVVDLRLAEEAAAVLREVECAATISFDKSEKFYTRPDTESGRKVMFESCYYHVEQQDGEDGYTFTAELDNDGKKTLYDYADGQLQLTVNGKADPAKKMTDAAARSRISNWFNTTFFDPHCLTTSEPVEMVSHRFKYKPVDLDLLGPKLVQIGSGVNQIRGNETSSLLSVYIDDDGKMVSYTYTATIWIYLRGSAYIFHYEVTVDNIQYTM